MPQKKFRKRKVESDSDEEDEDQRRQKMLEAKQLQQMRSKQVGIADGALKGSTKQYEEEEEEEEDKHTLESTFTDSAAAAKPQAAADEKVEQVEADGNQDSFKQMKKELFVTPDEFKDAVAPCKDKLAEEATWLTGIAEVQYSHLMLTLSGLLQYQLPVEYKIKNLEATEAAKANIIASKQAHMRLSNRQAGKGSTNALPPISVPNRPRRSW